MLVRSLAMASGLFLGAVTSQAPEFGQQYRQRMGGAIDELQTVIARFDSDSSASGFTRAAALDHMKNSSDGLVRRQSASVQLTVDRLDNLTGQKDAFDKAGKFGRLLVLCEKGDPQLLRNTFHAYEPSVPLTSEGFVFAGVGFVTGWGGLMLAALPFRRRRRRSAIRAH